MSSLDQIAANRRNAKKSTGPTTPAGKSASSRNALKTGIDAQSARIKGEDPEALAALTAEYHGRYCPATPEQRDLVDTLIVNTWLLRRLRRGESQLSFYRALHEFERLQAAPPPHEPPPQLIAVEPVNSGIGFVPPPASDPVIPPVAARTRASQIGFVPSFHAQLRPSELPHVAQTPRVSRSHDRTAQSP